MMTLNIMYTLHLTNVFPNCGSHCINFNVGSKLREREREREREVVSKDKVNLDPRKT